MEPFGKKLKKVRETLGLTQTDLAIRTGLQPANISHFETGEREPGLNNIVKLCKGLGCKPNVLIDVD